MLDARAHSTRYLLSTRAFQPGSRAHLRICLGKLDSRLTCSLVASPLSLDSSPYFVPSASPHHFTPSTPTTSPAASSPRRPLSHPPTTPLTIPCRRRFSFRQPRVLFNETFALIVASGHRGEPRVEPLSLELTVNVPLSKTFFFGIIVPTEKLTFGNLYSRWTANKVHISFLRQEFFIT